MNFKNLHTAEYFIEDVQMHWTFTLSQWNYVKKLSLNVVSYTNKKENF